MTEFKPKLWKDGSEFPERRKGFAENALKSKYFSESSLKTLVSNTGKVYIVYEKNKLGTPAQYKRQKDSVASSFQMAKKKVQDRNLLLKYQVMSDQYYKGGTVRVYANVLPLISAESEEE